MLGVPPLFGRVDEAPWITGISFRAGLVVDCQGESRDARLRSASSGRRDRARELPHLHGVPSMYVREVEPHWSLAKIDFVYECADCGAEVRQTIRKPDVFRH